MSRKRLDVEAEHRRIHQTVSHGAASNPTTDAQRYGHDAGSSRGTIRSRVSGSISGSGPATPHSQTVQKLVGKLPSHNQAFDVATQKGKFANPPKSGGQTGSRDQPRKPMAVGNSAQGMAGTPARVAKYRAVSRALGGPK